MYISLKQSGNKYVRLKISNALFRLFLIELVSTYFGPILSLGSNIVYGL